MVLWKPTYEFCQQKSACIRLQLLTVFLGIQEKLDYFENLGVTTIWLNPVYKSPQKDNGYDVEDYRDIDPLFGTLQDMEDLINEMHNRGSIQN